MSTDGKEQPRRVVWILEAGTKRHPQGWLGRYATRKDANLAKDRIRLTCHVRKQKET